MALAVYKDLCIDANDADRLGQFWAQVLHRQPHLGGRDTGRLTGATPEHTLWINPVPEPKTVKNRVHLDVNSSSVEEVVRVGGTVLDADSFPWTVMADPEGGEFCVFVREGEIVQRLYELVVDCSAPDQLAAWWSEVLGGHLGAEEEQGFCYVDQIPGAPFESIVFGPVPEPKTAKNRVHFDVTTPDLEALVAAGARVLRAPDGHIGWHVLADPEGNEFCAFLPDSASS